MSFNQFFEESEFDEVAEKARFVAHLDRLKDMPVEEQTLYQKWYELSANYKEWHNKAGIKKANIWTPTDIRDVEQTKAEMVAIKPRIRFVDPSDKRGIEEWTLYRVFVSSFNFDQNPGRFLRFMFEDEVTGKVLGLTSLGSDVISIGCRDTYIGWKEKNKLDGMLNHTAIGTTIVATQPLGYNFLGGKLLAAMLVTPVIRDQWKKSYGETLVGITTTSLYGNGSMYNSIPWWKSLGHTTGRIPLKPNDEFYSIWHEIVKKKYPDVYEGLLTNDDGMLATGVKGKILHLIFKEIGIKASAYMHGFERGVYFAPFYENTNEFLRQEITEDQLVPKARKSDIKTVMDWWTPKALKRYESLATDDKLKDEVLFYNQMLFMSWDEARTRYLGEVGR